MPVSLKSCVPILWMFDVAKTRYMNVGIQTQEWGRRDVSVIDPAGNHVIFSERIES